MLTNVTLKQGPERVKRLYAFRSLIDSGARIALGSDFPVETMNPLSGFYAAITRLSPDGKSPHGVVGWFVHQLGSILFWEAYQNIQVPWTAANKRRGLER